MSLIFDHHLTTAVQMPYEMPEKPVVTTNNVFFRCFAVAVQNQQNLRSNASLYRTVVVLRRQVPGRIPSGAPSLPTIICGPRFALHFSFPRELFLYAMGKTAKN